MGRLSNCGGGGGGTVFKANTDGTGFTNLYSFTLPNLDVSSQAYTNSDGFLQNGLILSANTLYGTAFQGGNSGAGTVFTVNTDGTGFTTLHSFTATSAPFPSTNGFGFSASAGLMTTL